MTPEYWIRFLDEHDLRFMECEIPDAPGSAPSTGGSLIIFHEMEIYEAATEGYIGSIVKGDGFIPVAEWDMGLGWCLINIHDGAAGPLYRIDCDALDDEDYDRSSAVTRVLDNYEALLEHKLESVVDEEQIVQDMVHDGSDGMDELRNYLAGKLPDIIEYFDDYKYEKRWEGPQSAYAVFTWIVRPYLDDLLKQGNMADLKLAWTALDYLARCWSGPVRNAIYLLVAEEMELYRHHEFLGIPFKELWLADLVWYPNQNAQGEPINHHFEKQDYERRWLEEVERIGGLGHLDDRRRSEIYRRLKLEFALQEHSPPHASEPT